MDPITSTQNQGIKDLLKLSRSRLRKETGLFTIEGTREIRRASGNGYSIDKIYYCSKLFSAESGKLLDEITAGARIEVSDHVFSRIAYRDNSDGLLAVAKSKEHKLSSVEKKENPLYLVIESVEKPGNLGAILRTADAAGIDAVIVCDPTTDLYNPNVIRSSIGCLFTNTVVLTDSETCVEFLKSSGVKIFAAALQESVPYTDADLSGPAAIVMGSEAKGLTKLWRTKAEKIISIPMKGDIDSLNVSVSAAILLFEALRQRT